MNYTGLGFIDERGGYYTPTLYIEQQENLTTWGIFLSSLLLSVSGAFAVCMSAVSKSKCAQIRCGNCMEIERDISNV